MIEINLLPEELKPEKKLALPALPAERLVLILPALAGLLILIHLYFAGAILIKNFQYRALNKKWLASKATQEEVGIWKKEHTLVSQDTQDIISLTKQGINFSDKLKVMSEVLPAGIWFNHLTIIKKDYILQGSIVSQKGEHMSLLRNFLEQLKKNKVFFSKFRRLELGPVKMREFKGYQIMDFILEGNLK